MQARSRSGGARLLGCRDDRPGSGGFCRRRWSLRMNYFNYFTEIEEYFWKKRGAQLLVSPLDWAILETWQKAGVPLEAVLRGIDRAFESYQRSRRARPLKSLAYCVDAVLDAAAQYAEAATGTGPAAEKHSGETDAFSREELAAFLDRLCAQLRQAAETSDEKRQRCAQYARQAGRSVGQLYALLDAPDGINLQDLETRLTVIEDRLAAGVLSTADEELLLKIRRELERQLAPYRRRMTAPQLSQLERQYLQKRLFEEYGLPRLSLFYLS